MSSNPVSWITSLPTVYVRYAEFTPRPVNQAGAQGEEAGRRLANGGARSSEEVGAKCISDVHTEFLDHYERMIG